MKKILLLLLLFAGCSVNGIKTSSSHHHNHHNHHHHHHRPNSNHNQEHSGTNKDPNQTWKASMSCPMMYSRVGQRCVALFSIGKVSWKTAKQFCESIYGDLLFFNNVVEFAEMLEYIQEQELEMDLWTGGHVIGDDWLWSPNNKMMPKGSPYWAIQFKSRGSSFIGSQGFYGNGKYVQGPFAIYPISGLHKARCVSMKSEYFYYLSNDECEMEMSPACVLRDDAQVVVANATNGALQNLCTYVGKEENRRDRSAVTESIPGPFTTTKPLETGMQDRDDDGDLENGEGSGSGYDSGSGYRDWLFFIDDY